MQYGEHFLCFLDSADEGKNEELRKKLSYNSWHYAVNATYNHKLWKYKQLCARYATINRFNVINE